MRWDEDPSRACYAKCSETTWVKRTTAEKSHRPICPICLSPTKETHHLDYSNWGHELSKDLEPLCGECHRIVSKITQYGRNESYCEVFVMVFLSGCLRQMFTLSAQDIHRYFSEEECQKGIREMANDIEKHAGARIKQLGIRGFFFELAMSGSLKLIIEGINAEVKKLAHAT